MSNNQLQDNFNSDLQLIRSISSYKGQSQSTRPRSVHELAALLKFKKKHNQTQRRQQIESSREWLVKKGINLQPLVSRVQLLKNQIVQPISEKVAQSIFHVHLDQQHIDEYLTKAEEYASLNLMQSIMMKDQTRKKITSHLLKTMLEENTSFTVWQCESNTLNRNNYIEITKNIVANEQEAVKISKRMLQEFQVKFISTQNNSIWQILGNQLSAYSVTNSLSINMTRMLISSLKLINQAFQRKINGQDFDFYVNNNYVSKVEYRKIQKKDSLWPKVFLAYCTGQKNKVQNLLSSDKRDQRDLMQLYQLSQQAISNGKPIKQKYIPHYDIQDIFYQQFIYNISGQSRYSHSFFADETSLQLILIFVRTIGIYYQSQKNKFQDITHKMVKKYKDLGADPNMIKNILYLIDYSSIVKMGVNSLMSKQDYLHFLVVIAGFPQLVKESYLKNNLIKSLVSFIIELINQKRSEYIYYIKLLPEDVQVQQTSSIINSVDGLQTFDWVALKSLVKQFHYKQIVVATIEKYRLRQDGELYAAMKLVQLCEDYQRSFGYLLTLFINHYLNRKKYSKEELFRAEELGLRWSNQRGYGSVYQMLFQLIASLRQLNLLIIKRNQQKIRQFIASCEFVDIKLHQPNSLYSQMLRILVQNKGLDLYYYFLRLVIKGAEIYTVQSGDNQKLSLLKSLLHDQLEQIQRLPWVKNEFQCIHLKALKEQLIQRILDLL